MADILKIHVHTDTPEAVFTYAARWGRVETTKADDMRAQHRRLAHAERRPVAVVSDSSADLADSVLDRHHIALVPLQVVFGDETFRDRVELRPEEFYRRLRAAKRTAHHLAAHAGRVRPGAPGRPERGRRSGRRPARPARCRARSPRRRRRCGRPGSDGRPPGGQPVGLARAWGCWRSGAPSWPSRAGAAAEIAAELERVRGQSGMLLTVDRYDNLIRSGRVSRGKAWIAGMLDVKPILSLDRTGRVVPVDRVRGREQLVPRVLALLERRLTPRPRVVRFGVVHAEAPEMAERVRTALVAAYRPRDCFVSLATGVLGTHVGAGAWAVFYQVEDGTPARLDAVPRGPKDRHACRNGSPGDAPDSGGAAPGAGRHQDLKGSRLVVLDLRGLTDATDFFVIASGTSDAHVRGIAESVMDKLDRQGPSHASRGRTDRAAAGCCSTSWISWSTCSTRRPAPSISSSGSGTTHRSC